MTNFSIILLKHHDLQENQESLSRQAFPLGSNQSCSQSESPCPPSRRLSLGTLHGLPHPVPAGGVHPLHGPPHAVQLVPGGLHVEQEDAFPAGWIKASAHVVVIVVVIVIIVVVVVVIIVVVDVVVVGHVDDGVEYGGEEGEVAKSGKSPVRSCRYP